MSTKVVVAWILYMLTMIFAGPYIIWWLATFSYWALVAISIGMACLGGITGAIYAIIHNRNAVIKSMYKSLEQERQNKLHVVE